MNRRYLLFVLLLLLLAAALFLLAPRLAVHTAELVYVPPAKEEKEEVPPEETDFVRPLREELAGEYVLTSLSTKDLLLSPDELSSLRGLGIPLGMTLYADETAVLAVFDIRADLRLDADAMLILIGEQSFPFFYQDGRITVWDSGSRAVFSKSESG